MDDKTLMAELEKNPANMAQPTTEPEVKEVQPEVAPEAPAEEAKPQQTMGEMMGTQPVVETKVEKKDDTVPLSAFLDLKKDLKEMKEALKEAKDSKGNVASADVAAIAEQFGVDAGFLEQYGKTIADKTQKELEAKFMPLLEKQDREKRQVETAQLFEKVFNDALTELPEYGKVVNKDVIKALAFSPANANKTLPQIIEETYGNAIQGRPSIETTRPAPNKEEHVDFDKMTPEQAAEASADPRQAGKYTEYLISKGLI